jgi:hypothetical protein
MHYVTVQGLEQRAIFPGDDERADFLRRLARLLPETQTACAAWCLLPNDVHLALRSGPRGLAHVMRRLLTGYAASFNRRHGRVGHVFQSRYHSSVCEEGPYLTALVRFIHLYPLRAGIASSLTALAEYPWCGHGALLGRTDHPWQATNEVLAHFAEQTESARRAYETFVSEGLDRDGQPRPRTETAERLAARAIGEAIPESSGNVASQDVWGSPAFAAGLRARLKHDAVRPAADCRAVVAALCRALGLSPQALASGRRTRPLSNGRAVVAYVARTRFRIPCAELAAVLGTSPPAVTLAERRGAQLVKRRVDLKACLSEFLK